MKYKRQLVSSMLAFTMIAGISSAFAADIASTSTKVDQVKNQIKMKDDNRDGKIDKKDSKGNDLEEKDSTKSSASILKKGHKKGYKVHRNHKEKVVSTTTAALN